MQISLAFVKKKKSNLPNLIEFKSVIKIAESILSASFLSRFLKRLCQKPLAGCCLAFVTVGGCLGQEAIWSSR